MAATTFFLDQELILYRYSSCSFYSCLRSPLQKSLRRRRFKSDRDEIRQECSSSKYVSIDGKTTLSRLSTSVWVWGDDIRPPPATPYECSQLPSISIDVTMTLVIRAKTQNVRCVVRPNRARITCRKVLAVHGITQSLSVSISRISWIQSCRNGCRKVLAPGACSLSCTVSMEKRRIWIVAPDAYQNAPLIPYWKKTNKYIANVE